MGKGLSKKENMKKVIDSLREGKKTWSDLKKLEIPDKTLERILKENLEYFGLAKKEEGYWVWYEYSMTFNSKAEYDLEIEHSRKLIPALKSLSEINVEARNSLHDLAKEHLRFYPKIFVKLEKFEEVFNKRVRYLLENHEKKIVGPESMMILDPIKVKGKGPLGKLFSKTKFKKRDSSFTIQMDSSEMKFEELEKTEEYKEVKELRDFLEGNTKFHDRFELFKELTGDLELLSLKIDWGQPLEGKCKHCPNIKFSPSNHYLEEKSIHK